MDIIHVRDHVEVYEGGVFLFSADTEAEAHAELRKMEEIRK